jgi:hypothetical protein
MAVSGKLFYEDEFDALNQMLAHSARTHKELAGYLFPDLKPESAYAKLKACLNPNGDERLKFGQIIAAMRFCEQYDPLYYACDETLHARPPRIAPEDEKVRVIETIRAAGQTMERAMATLKKLQETEQRNGMRVA